MVKAGLIGAVTGFIYVMSLSLVSPLCTLCFTPLLAVGVGYLAARFDRPPNPEKSLHQGSIAGAITGLGVAGGQMLAAVVNGILVTHSEQLPKLMQEMGLSPALITDNQQFWQTTLSSHAACSAFNLVLISGLGAVGGMVWFQRRHKNPLSTVSV